jgi:hypothetical protein
VNQKITCYEIMDVPFGGLEASREDLQNPDLDPNPDSRKRLDTDPDAIGSAPTQVITRGIARLLVFQTGYSVSAIVGFLG